jgi:hypothetical protein
VPIDSLAKLIQVPELNNEKNLTDVLLSQLQANSDRLIQQLLEGDWTTIPLGNAHALGEVTEFLRCWGNSKNTDDLTNKMPYYATRSCQTDHNIFINQSLLTGKIEMQFYWIESEEINSIRFYNHYQRIFSQYRPANFGREKDLSSWVCEEDFVTLSRSHSEMTKSIFCVRAYKKLTGLYDVFYLQGSVGRSQEAYMTHFTIAGITMESALTFTEKFMGSALW